jgi:hypothetical protein
MKKLQQNKNKLSEKEKAFRQSIWEWVKILKIPLKGIRRDNRISDLSEAVYCGDETGNIVIYHENLLKQKDYQIQRTMFHELGHVKFKHQGESEKNEYEAEKFMLECIKKYFPNFLYPLIKEGTCLLKNKEWQKDYPIHYKGFSRLWEYK